MFRFVRVRKDANSLQISQQKYLEWGSCRTYNKFLHKLESSGIIERGRGYLVNKQSKRVKCNFAFTGIPVKINNRTGNFDETVTTAFQSSDFYQLLQQTGMCRQSAYLCVQTIYR